MAAPVVLLILVCSANLVWKVSSDATAMLECPTVSYGLYGREARILCSVKGRSRVDLLGVVWRRAHPGAQVSVVSFFGLRGANENRVEPGWNRTSMDVWLLVRDVRVADQGRYTCSVLTNRGSVELSTSLKVIARYSDPAVWSVPERNIEDDMAVTMFCQAVGGFPRGTVQWFDQYGTNWTRSAKTDAREREDGRFELTSEFGVRRASSVTPGYRCCVISSDGGKEGEAEIHLVFRIPEKRVQRWSNNSIVAVIVVAGSLTTGLLLLVLLQRRRPQHEVYMEEEDMQNKEEAPEMEEEVKTTC